VSNPKLSVYGKYEQACARIRELEAERTLLLEHVDKWQSAFDDQCKRMRELEAALTDLEMAVSDLMREEDFEVSETLSTALDIARAVLAPKEPT